MYTQSVFRSATQINEAMSRVYFYMMTAVLNSMFVAYLVSNNAELMATLFGSNVKWLVLFSPIIAAIALPFILNGAGKLVSQLALHGFAALMGLSLSLFFKAYTGASIVSAFSGAAVLFGTMSLYAYFTKHSNQTMDSLGKYCMIALIAIIIASIINIFIGSSVMQMVISAIAIVVFMAFTVYDTMTIREMVSTDSSPSAEVMGAITLYLDFINLFVNLLQLFGDRDD
jgi:FtsH-binding integral membrane protein